MRIVCDDRKFYLEREEEYFILADEITTIVITREYNEIVNIFLEICKQILKGVKDEQESF